MMPIPRAFLHPKRYVIKRVILLVEKKLLTFLKKVLFNVLHIDAFHIDKFQHRNRLFPVTYQQS